MKQGGEVGEQAAVYRIQVCLTKTVQNPVHVTIFTVFISTNKNLLSQVAPAPKRKREDEDYDAN